MTLQPINEDVYRYLFPTVKELEHEPNAEYATNNILQRQVLLIGAQGSGKSTSAQQIALQAVIKYGKENVNACSSMEFELLMEYGIKDCLVNILFFDDATLAKIDSKTVRDFFRIRHLVREYTGRSNGLIITIVGAHRYHSMTKELRSTSNLVLWKSPPTNPYDRSIARNFVGDSGIQLLESIELEKQQDTTLIGMCVAYFLNKVGVFYTPHPRYNVIQEIVYE